MSESSSIFRNQIELMTSQSTLETYFMQFRNNIIGLQQTFESPFGKKEILYADWTASGQAYAPIEKCIQNEVLPFLGNTHTATTITGTMMSEAYEKAKKIVKKHVGANSDDVLIFCGSGMTAAVNKLQRILGMRIPERVKDYIQEEAALLPLDEELKPVVFVTHMEHHSNHTSWLETIATVEIIKSNKYGNVDMEHFEILLEKYKQKKNKIAAITACSNVTGIQTPYHQIAKLIHKYDGFCFVDFACSAPYITIDMHPAEKGTHLDAIYFSGHKFLGGAGTPGVLIFNRNIYNNKVPDQPGGGTVTYSNPWKGHDYINSIEQREDGGTPPFLGGIKTAMCIRLKEAMCVENILHREEELLQIIFNRFSLLPNIEVLEENYKNRLGIVSFIVKGAHYNGVVKILNDWFGIQTRGGCSCAGTYGHTLLHIDEKKSYRVLGKIRSGDLSCKPGWVRLSIHPTMTDANIHFIMDAIETVATNFHEWIKEYVYNPSSNEFSYKRRVKEKQSSLMDWFTVSSWLEPFSTTKFAKPVL